MEFRQMADMEIINNHMMEEEINHRVRIGKRIAELRKLKGVSQSKLATLTGLDSGYIGRLEMGRIDVGIENLSKIGDMLDADIDFILRK